VTCGGEIISGPTASDILTNRDSSQGGTSKEAPKLAEKRLGSRKDKVGERLSREGSCCSRPAGVHKSKLVEE
jgi:hypothetical protein